MSKHVSALEARLAVRLLNRTTRRVSPTELGLVYYDRALAVLAAAGEADSMVTAMQATPTGSLRVSAPVSFGVGQVAPAVAAFLCAHPQVDVQMVLEDRFVELVAEGYDVAVRIGALADSSLRARKLAETRGVMVASPGYLAEAGVPRSIDDLGAHRLLHYSHLASGNFWRLRTAVGRGAAGAGRRPADGQQRRGADEGGRGGPRHRAWCPTSCSRTRSPPGGWSSCCPTGRPDILGVYAVYPEGRFPQPKLRAFIDFLAEHFRGRGPGSWT